MRHTCLMAVKNPCGLKNPVIQKAFGLPWLHQRLNWLSLSNNSVYQNPRVADSQDICFTKRICHAQKNHQNQTWSPSSGKFMLLRHGRFFSGFFFWIRKGIQSRCGSELRNRLGEKSHNGVTSMQVPSGGTAGAEVPPIEPTYWRISEPRKRKTDEKQAHVLQERKACFTRRGRIIRRT